MMLTCPSPLNDQPPVAISAPIEITPTSTLGLNRHFPLVGFIGQDGAPEVYVSGAHWYYSEAFRDASDDARTAIAAVEQASQIVETIVYRAYRGERRANWRMVRSKVLRMVLIAKGDQDAGFRAALMATGSAPLVYADKADSFLGIGADGHGENRYGKLLCKARAALQAGLKKTGVVVGRSAARIPAAGFADLLWSTPVHVTAIAGRLPAVWDIDRVAWAESHYLKHDTTPFSYENAVRLVRTSGRLVVVGDGHRSSVMLAIREHTNVVTFGAKGN